MNFMLRILYLYILLPIEIRKILTHILAIYTRRIHYAYLISFLEHDLQDPNYDYC